MYKIGNAAIGGGDKFFFEYFAKTFVFEFFHKDLDQGSGFAFGLGVDKENGAFAFVFALRNTGGFYDFFLIDQDGHAQIAVQRVQAGTFAVEKTFHQGKNFAQPDKFFPRKVFEDRNFVSCVAFVNGGHHGAGASQSVTFGNVGFEIQAFVQIPGEFIQVQIEQSGIFGLFFLQIAKEFTQLPVGTALLIGFQSRGFQAALELLIRDGQGLGILYDTVLTEQEHFGEIFGAFLGHGKRDFPGQVTKKSRMAMHTALVAKFY